MKIPLAERMRPRRFEEFIGQEHLVGEGGVLRSSMGSGHPQSVILWGPPGCGKTSLAKLYAESFDAELIPFHAVFSGVADLRKVVERVEKVPLFSRKTVLHVDEIHRFSKSQQDAFLPYVERGTFVLVGTTTENPSFALNDALLSRVQVLQVHPLNTEALHRLLQRCEESLGKLPLDEEARCLLLEMAQGDGRYLLNLVETLLQSKLTDPVTPQRLQQIAQRRASLFDKQGEQHFNLISALHKSVRGSDPDAALYWFARMLEGGEDPLYLARRLVRMATEDIGLADPQALQQAIAGRDAYQQLGTPEGELALAQVVVYLSLAPKSNSLYTAYKGARAHAAKTTHYPPPKTILNAPTKLMRQMGYGEGYWYDHEAPDGFSGQNYFPEGVERERYYCPIERGFEREMTKRLHYFRELRRERERRQ